MKIKLLALLAIASLSALNCHAQTSFNFTLFDDPAFCTLQNCTTWVGSGSFTTGAPITQLEMTLYPITNLTGTLNGLPLGLFVPPVNNRNADFFYTTFEPIAPFFPLLLSSNGTLRWNIQSTDFNHIGSGQSLYDYNAGQFSQVTFAVQPKLNTRLNPLPPSQGPPLTFAPTTPPAATPGQIQAALNRQAGINIGLAVGIPVATAAVVWLVHHEMHRPRREAYPAGRIE